MPSLLRMKSRQLFMYSFGLPLFIGVAILGVLFVQYLMSMPALFFYEVDESYYIMELEAYREVVRLVPLFLLPVGLTGYYYRWKQKVVLFVWQDHLNGQFKFSRKLFQFAVWTPFIGAVLLCSFAPIYLTWFIDFELHHLRYAYDPDFGGVMHYTTKRVLISTLILIPLVLLFSILELWTSLETARAINSAEQNRKVSAGEVVKDWFLVTLYPIGFFILQPRVNSLGLKDSIDREIEYLG